MPSPVLAPFVLGLAIAAGCDVSSRRIPNWLVATLFALGLWARAFLGGPSAVVVGFSGAALGLGLLVVPFCLRWLGGGDVKLLCAVGMWLGPSGVVQAALFGLALGGVYGIVLAVSSRSLRREVATNLLVVASGVFVAPERRKSSQTVPLGAALAAAALGVLALAGGPGLA